MPNIDTGPRSGTAFTATRAAGLERLEAFVPCAGRDYQSNRNHDTGPDWPHVSTLAPWLHAGLLSEREVLEAALREHGMSSAYKFVSEVFWRVYFKGHLEQRPDTWNQFCRQRDEALAALEDNAGLRTAYAEAVEGRTGIEAFDTWVRELVEHGFLHNHARMWFASIWCFTLKLDWTLGADLFLRHLMCGDPASNTLNWRWVAGLHTRGKAYAATQGNITRYTERRENGPLRAEGLARGIRALEEADPPGKQPLDLPDAPSSAQFDQPFALLLHGEAAHHEPLGLPRPPALVIAAARPQARSPGPIGEPAREFAMQALRSGSQDAAKAFGCPVAQWEDGKPLAALLADAGIERLAVPHLPVGWTRDALAGDIARFADAEDGNAVLPLVSELSRATWPYAKAGFFGVRKKMEPILRETGVAGV